MFDEYLWIVVCGCMVAFVMAFGIGANDVANAFATSVGSKAITMKQAVLIAAVFEFAGAMALGASVSGTIQGGIAKSAVFKANPEVLMYGMLCALTAASIWLLLATYLELPVSTTHSIVGAVLGMGLAWGGAPAVNWITPSEEFPFFKGFVVIVVSWFLSPVLSGAVAACFFLLTRFLILRRKNSYQLSFWSLPFIVLLCVFIMVFFVLFKGTDKSYKLEASFSVWVAAVAGVGAAILTAAVILPLLRKRVQAQIERDAAGAADDLDKEKQVAAVAPAQSEEQNSVGHSLAKAAMHGLDYDIFKAIEEDPIVAAMHARAEKFNPHTEEAFKYVQVFTACADSFSHGANDVGNAIGPLAAIWTIYTTSSVPSTSQVPKWILVLGGAGIVVGLATYGYNIMKALGVKSVTITPSRGYCIELASALVIAAGSYLGLPLSTTHCQVGGTYGVGLVEGIHATNWMAFLKYFAGWVMTVIFAGFVSALLFLQGVAAPGRVMAQKLVSYEKGVQNITMSTLNVLNTTNMKYAGTPQFNSTLNRTIANTAKNVSALYKKGNINPSDSIKFLRTSNALYANSSVLTIGGVVCETP